MRTLLSLATLAACGPAVSAAEFHAAQSPTGETVSVAVVAKRDCKANVIGLQLYEVVLSGEVGAVVLYHAQYYRTDDRAIAADEETILVKGFPSRDTVEIEQRKEAKHWLIDRTAGRPFDEAARRLAENPESTEVVLDLYKKFRTSPFPLVTAPDRSRRRARGGSSARNAATARTSASHPRATTATSSPRAPPCSRSARSPRSNRRRTGEGWPRRWRVPSAECRRRASIGRIRRRRWPRPSRGV